MQSRTGIKGVAVAVTLLMLSCTLTMNTTTSDAAVTSEWEMEDPLPVNKSCAVTVTGEDGLVYVIGGYNITNGVITIMGNTTSYNLTTGVSSELANMPTAVMGAAGALGEDGRIYVFGGFTSSYFSSIVAITQIYDPVTNTWTTGASMPHAVAWTAAASYDLIYVVGGSDTAGTRRAYVQIYDPSDDSWTEGTPLPVATTSGAMVAWSGSLYYIGGMTSVGQTSNVYLYDIYDDEWEAGASLPSPKVGLAAVLGADGFIYTMGGGQNAYITQKDGSTSVYYYNPSNGTWSTGSPLLYELKYAGAAAYDGRIFVLGGEDGAALFAVSSLELMRISTSASPGAVAPGQSVTITIDVWTRYSTPEQFMLMPIMKDSEGVSFASSMMSVQMVALSTPFTLVMTVPESAAPGTYCVEFYHFAVYFEAGMDTFDVPDQAFTVAGEPFSDQVSDLRDQVDDLRDQVEDLSDRLNETASATDQSVSDVQRSVDGKADATMSYVMVVLLVVIIAMMALMMVMARRKA